MNVRILRELPVQQWKAYVDEHPSGNIFHTPEMFQVFAYAKGYRPQLWAATNGERILALFLPVNVFLSSGLLAPLTTRSIAYGSILFTPSTEGRYALSLLLKTYVREVEGHPLFTELRNLSDLGCVQPILSQHGFTYEDHLNYLIDLDRPVEAIFQSIGCRTRKNLNRKHNRENVVIEEVTDRSRLPLCYEMLRRTFQAARVPLSDPSLFEAAYDLLVPLGMARFSLATINDRPAAVSIELLYKDIAYGWYGGMDREFRAYCPCELITWDVLKWAAEHGFKVYDFGGAGKPDEEYGVRDFKAKFGGKLVCYGRNMFVHAPHLLSLSRVGYGLLRSIKGMIPSRLSAAKHASL